MPQARTYYEAFHLIFPNDLHAQGFPDFVVELEGAATGGHDTQLIGFGAILAAMVGLQIAYKLDARIYPFRLEFEEVQAAAIGALVGLTREVDEFGEGASNLDVRELSGAGLRAGERPKATQGGTYIDGNMADDGGVVWQADVAWVVLVVVAAWGGGLLFGDNEGALHVDAHIARMQDGVVNVRLDRGPSRTGRIRRR